MKYHKLWIATGTHILRKLLVTRSLREILYYARVSFFHLFFSSSSFLVAANRYRHQEMLLTVSLKEILCYVRLYF